MKKQITSAIVFMLLSVVFTSCKVEYVELKETSTEELSKNTDGIVSKEVIKTPTINFDEILSDTTKMSETEESESIDETEKEETLSETTAEEVLESDTLAEETKVNIFDLNVTEDDRVFHGSISLDPREHWQYGMTPCEWVYIEPGIQIISNYKPNTSASYSINSKVSSGLKGCYVPIFTRTDIMGNEYDARVYIFDDYSKEIPDNMLFSNTLANLTYKGKSVDSILAMNMDLSRTANGLLKSGGKYINIIYVTDLDKLLNNE